MPVYNWQGRTRDGAKKKGALEAANEAAVTAQLRSQGILPAKVKVKSKDVEEIFTFLQKKVKTKDLVIFTRQFAVMIDAGLPLVQCLHILGDQSENPSLARVINEVRNDVESGSTFAEALGKHPEDLRRPLRQPRRGRRGRRHPRHHPESAGGPAREGRQARAPVQGGDGLSDHGEHDRGGRGRPAARQGDPGLREDVRGLRRDPAGSHADGDRSLGLDAGECRLLHHRDRCHHHGSLPGPGPQRRLPLSERQVEAEAAALRQHHQEGRGGPLHPHAGHDDREWRSHPRRPRDRGQDRGQHGHRGGAVRDARLDLGGQDDRRATPELEGVSRHDGADDRGRRGDGKRWK